MSLHPDTRICTQLKSCTVTNFWLRDNLYRDTAPVPIYQLSATETNSRLTYQTCTATRVMLNKICTRTAKTRAIPSLHRDSFLAKVPGPCPDAASGNTTSPYCRAVRLHSSSKFSTSYTLIIFWPHYSYCYFDNDFSG